MCFFQPEMMAPDAWQGRASACSDASACDVRQLLAPGASQPLRRCLGSATSVAAASPGTMWRWSGCQRIAICPKVWMKLMLEI